MLEAARGALQESTDEIDAKDVIHLQERSCTPWSVRIQPAVPCAAAATLVEIVDTRSRSSSCGDGMGAMQRRDIE